MSDHRPTKRFSLEDANKTLPLVAAIVEDWAELTRRVGEREQRVEKLTNGRELSSDDPYADELTQVQRELTKSRQQIQEYLRELRHLGVRPGDSVKGTVDFLCEESSDVERVYCWQLGEAEVCFSHGADEDCDARQRLTADLVSGSDEPTDNNS